MRFRPHVHRGHVWIPLLLLVLIHWGVERPSMADPAEVTRASHVYLRSGPGTDFTPEDVLRAGDRVETLEVLEEWTKVRTETGQVGYIHRAYLNAVERDAASDDTAPPAGEARADSPPPAPRSDEPDPKEAETTAAAATPEPAAVKTLKEEVVNLREEVQHLRRQMRGELPLSTQNDQAKAVGEKNDDAISIPTSGVLLDRSDESSVGQPGVRVVAVGLVSLAVGWILGATLSRRRSRSQRSKLRF